MGKKQENTIKKNRDTYLGTYSEDGVLQPTLPHEVLAADVVYPAVLLAHGRPLSLFSVMVSCLQSGLCILTLSFCGVEIMEEMRVMLSLIKISNRRGKLLVPVLSCLIPTWKFGMSCTVHRSCQRCRSQSEILFLSFRSLNAQDSKVFTWLLFEELYKAT